MPRFSIRNTRTRSLSPSKPWFTTARRMRSSTFPTASPGLACAESRSKQESPTAAVLKFSLGSTKARPFICNPRRRVTMQTLSRKAATGILIAMSMYLPAALAAEKSFDRTLSVNGPVTLHVSTGSGYIHVSPGSDNQVHIVGHVKSSNSWGGGSSDDAVSKVTSNPPINQAGNIIRVGEGSDDSMRHVSIDYEITTPANTMLAAESGSGDLQLSSLNGTVQAHTG